MQRRLSTQIILFARSFAQIPLSSRCISSSSGRHSFSCFSLQNCLLQNHLLQQTPALPGDFLKWVSLGCCRESRFATGFTPLEPKPLDSIIDVERANKCSPEELVSVWDDVNSTMLPFCIHFF